MDLFARMLRLSSEGFACAQIMMILVLESEDREDPDLIRTVGALNNGLRDNGLVCGAFTGGACMLSYFAGQGETDEVPDPAYDAMTQELYAWFVDHVGGRYGGIECPVILDGDKSNKLNRCPGIVEDTFNRAMEILEGHELL
jgi:hypothetical protein